MKAMNGIFGLFAAIPARWFDYAAFGGVGLFAGIGIGQCGCFHWPW